MPKLTVPTKVPGESPITRTKKADVVKNIEEAMRQIEEDLEAAVEGLSSGKINLEDLADDDRDR